jgi:hypothetical protein
VTAQSVVIKEYYGPKNDLRSVQRDTIGVLSWLGGTIETYKYNYKNQLTSYEYFCDFNDEDTSGYFLGYRAWKQINYNAAGDTDEIIMANRDCPYGRARTIFRYDAKKRLTRRESYDLCASALHFITVQDHYYSADGKTDSINSRKISEDSPEADKTFRYDIFVYRGDSLSSLLSYYNFALLYYAEAEKIKPGEKDTRAKIDGCNHMLSIQNGVLPERKYMDLVAAGDFSFAKKDYKSAKTVYEKALLIKPGDQYLEKQLGRCEELSKENKK